MVTTQKVDPMALYKCHTPEYREDIYSLFEHARRISNRNDIHIEVIIEDLIHRNLTDY